MFLKNKLSYFSLNTFIHNIYTVCIQFGNFFNKICYERNIFKNKKGIKYTLSVYTASTVGCSLKIIDLVSSLDLSTIVFQTAYQFSLKIAWFLPSSSVQDFKLLICDSCLWSLKAFEKRILVSPFFPFSFSSIFICELEK